MDNYVACGFPCFLDNRKLEKNLLTCGGKGLCEANNKMYGEQQISTKECAHCAKNFIAKSFVDPDIIKCVEEKNNEFNLSRLSVDVNIDCYECIEDLMDGNFKIFYSILIV